MHIKKKNIYGYYNIQDRFDEGGWWWGRMLCMGDDHFEHLEDIKIDLQAIDTLIDSDFNNISDVDFYYLISRFYSFDLTITELLNIISRANDSCYDKFELLNTRQTFCISEQEGHGKDLNCWVDKYQVRWIVTTAKDFNLNADYNYSIDEIEQMILNKQIVAIIRQDKFVGTDSVKLPYQEEDFKDINVKIACNSEYIEEYLYAYNYNLPFNFDFLEYEKNNFSKKIYNEGCYMIRMILNKEEVLKNCMKILLFLKNEIDKVFPRIQKGYFFVYSDKEKYLNLTQEIKEFNKELFIKLENIENEKNSHKVLKKNL